jgi:hypothetical protein
MTFLGSVHDDSEWKAVVGFDTKTLVDVGGTIRREGPVVLGIRYLEQYLCEAPHPMGLVTVLKPLGVFHPNIADSGAVCLGHPAPGISLELILHQLWAGLMFNMQAVNTRPGEIVNREAAMYVRANAQQFPISKRGLFEQPDEDLRNNRWHIAVDPRFHATGAQRFVDQRGGADE